MSFSTRTTTLILLLHLTLNLQFFVMNHLEAQSEQKPPLQLLDLFDLEIAVGPQISPDGKRIVYVRQWADIMSDKRFSNIWLMNIDGSEHRPISAGKFQAHNPIWSPDGKKLAFISNEQGSSQIFVRWNDSGETAAISNLTEPPSALKWSPDGKLICFSKLGPEAPVQIGKLPQPPEGATWAAPAKMTDQLIFRFDGVGEIKPGYNQLFVISAEGGAPKQITTGDYHNGGFAYSGPSYDWSPDSKSIILSANRTENWENELFESEIYEFLLAGGQPKQLTKRKGPDREIVVSPDGKHIAYTGFNDRRQGYQVRHLHLANRDGSNIRILAENLDRTIYAPRWAADGQSIYALFTTEGETKLAQFMLDGSYELIVEGLGASDLAYSAGDFTVSKTGVFAFTMSNPQTLSEVGIRTKKGVVKKISTLNDGLFQQRQLGEVEEIWWESSKDNKRIQGWMIKPPGFDPTQKYPLILEIHGGPFASYGPKFDSEKQLMAASGAVVLYANPRGSTSYGEEFGNLIHHAYPGDDFYDLNSGVDAVIEKGFIDPDQLYVAGGSGGGVLTAWMISNTDRFKAAVSFYPVINWESFNFTADIASRTLGYWFPGMPWDHPENYRKRSLLEVSKNVQTPTLIMTGEEDWRTPMSESEQYYKALKMQGVETVLVRVPGESHGIRKSPSHHMAKISTLLGWFEKHNDKKKKP
ncbi:MAG: S9 family peptidase [Saprospiraceae bacterium]|nr:S9 family peptidase [Saprospiraceae bacterium]